MLEPGDWRYRRRAFAIFLPLLLLGLTSCRPSPPRSAEPASRSGSNPSSSTVSQSPSPGPEAEPTDALPVEAPREIKTPARPVVLLDSYHAHNFIHRGLVPGEHNYHCYTGLRRASKLLEQRGCEVRELLVGPLTPEHLADVQLIVLNLPSMDRPPWLISELLAVEDFIRGGGGMIFITDHSNCYYHQYHLLPLWDRLGLIPTFETVCERSPDRMLAPGSPGWLIARDFVQHPISDDVRYFAMQTGGRVVSEATSGDGIIAWTSDQAWADAGTAPLYGEGPVGLFGDMRYSDSEEQGKQGIVLARSAGHGRVVVICDQNSLGDAAISYAHNWRLWVNASRWCGRFGWDQSQHDMMMSAAADTAAADTPTADASATFVADPTGQPGSVSSATAVRSAAADTSGDTSSFEALIRSEPDRNALPAARADAWNVHCWEPISAGRFHWGGDDEGQYYNFWCWMNRWYWVSAADQPLRPREFGRGKPMLLAVESDLRDEALLALARATLARHGKVILLSDDDSEAENVAATAEAAEPRPHRPGDTSAETKWAVELAGRLSDSQLGADDLSWRAEPVAHWGAEVAGGWLVMVRSTRVLRNARFTRPDVAPDGRQLAWQNQLHRWLFDQP